MTGCSVDGCDRSHFGHGFCNAHYGRWRRHGDPLGGRTSPGRLAAFLDLAAAFVGSECLDWPYGKTAGGYPQVRVNGVNRRAHRVVLERVQGPPPSADMHAAHAPAICHNRSCVNPAHLRWATPVQNQADQLADGTQARGQRLGKLTEPQVLEVRADHRLLREIAADYGVSEPTVSMIKSRTTWAWLDDPHPTTKRGST